VRAAADRLAPSIARVNVRPPARRALFRSRSISGADGGLRGVEVDDILGGKELLFRSELRS
jgi:hypothetical protein